MSAETSDEKFLRKASLMLIEGEEALDLSEMRFTFETRQDDEQSPNNVSIRVYNLTQDTTRKVKGEYTRVVLQAGYEGAAYGVIFDGTIKQLRIGRENATSNYIDILAADGDIAYNYAVVNTSLDKTQTTPAQRIQAVIDSMKPYGVTAGTLQTSPAQGGGLGGVLPRGKVLFGLARTFMRRQCQDIEATWSVGGGKVNVTKLASYLPSEVVTLTSGTGLLGRPEQTQDGVTARCLINPRIQVGGLVRINNASVNQTVQQKNSVIPGAQQPYNRYAGVQLLADVTADGLYRVYVSEFKGDTRGLPWWQDLTLLAVDPVALTVKAG